MMRSIFILHEKLDDNFGIKHRLALGYEVACGFEFQPITLYFKRLIWAQEIIYSPILIGSAGAY